MIVASDLDQVLVMCEDAWKHHALRTLNKSNFTTDESKYKFHERFGITHDEEIHVFKTFDWSSPEPYDGIVKATESLRDAGHQLHIITSTDAEFKDIRAQGLIKHGLVFEDIHCIGSKGCKRDKIEEINPFFYVDDLPHHLVEAQNANVHCLYHINRGYSEPLNTFNLDLSKVESVESFNHAVDCFLLNNPEIETGSILSI